MTVQWAWDLDPGGDEVSEDFLVALRERVDAVVQENEWRYIDFLCDLLRLPTISGAVDRRGQRVYREAMDECLARVQMEAEKLGMDWREHEGIAAIAEWRGRRGQHRSVGVAAHLDVVPPAGSWSRNPFGGDVADGEIWGRGAQDDKGGVAMAFGAFDVLQRLGLVPRSDMRLFLGTMEETDDWRDMDLLLEREKPTEFTLVPDGAFPVIVGEKGLLTVQWNASWSPVQTDGLRFVGLSGGERHNQVPSHATLWFTCKRGDEDATFRRLQSLGPGELRLAREPPPAAGDDPCFEMVFEGRAAHAAFPELGHNAILDALEALVGILGDRGVGSFARLLMDKCAKSDGSGLRLDHHHTRMGRTTLNLGVAQLGESSGHVEISVRFPFGLHLEEVKSRFREPTESIGGDLRLQYMTRGRPHEALFVSPEDHPHLIHTLQSAYRAGTGREPRLASIAGTTYAKVFPLAVPFGPQDESAGEEILAHQVDERITIERFRENIRVYAIALALLGCDREDLEKMVGETER